MLLFEEIIDKILSFDKYGDINLIIAFNLKKHYINKYSNIIKKANSHKLNNIEIFLCSWRLNELLNNRTLYKLDQEVLDSLPEEIWTNLSRKKYLKESFIVKNSHNINLAMVKYFRKGKFSHRFHNALPEFKNLCKKCI